MDKSRQQLQASEYGENFFEDILKKVKDSSEDTIAQFLFDYLAKIKSMVFNMECADMVRSEIQRRIEDWLTDHDYCYLCGTKFLLHKWNEYHPEVQAYEPMCEPYCPNCDV